MNAEKSVTPILAAVSDAKRVSRIVEGAVQYAAAGQVFWDLLFDVWNGVSYAEAKADATDARAAIVKAAGVKKSSAESYLSNALRCIKAGAHPASNQAALADFNNGVIAKTNGGFTKPKMPKGPIKSEVAKDAVVIEVGAAPIPDAGADVTPDAADTFNARVLELIRSWQDKTGSDDEEVILTLELWVEAATAEAVAELEAKAA